MTVAAGSPAQHFFVIFGAAVTAFGLLFVLVGLLIRRASHGFRGAARTQGTIVDFQSGGSGGMSGPSGWAGGLQTGGIVYRPTVEFATADGTPVRATSNIGTNPRPGRVGDTVTVLYDPRNPQRVRVQSGKAVLTVLELGFLMFGGSVAALGIIILIAAR